MHFLVVFNVELSVTILLCKTHVAVGKWNFFLVLHSMYLIDLFAFVVLLASA